MNYPKKVVVAVDAVMDLEYLRPLSRLDFLSKAEIHLVHIAPKFAYPDGIGIDVTYPAPGELDRIYEAVVTKLTQQGKEVMLNWHEAKLEYDCLFAFEPAKRFCEYLKQEAADLGIILTRKKHGLFSPSFAQDVAVDADCDVLVFTE